MGINVDPGDGDVPVEPSFAYATSSTLATWLGSTPANADALLRSATVVVAEAANRNPYTDNAPDAATALVLSDATCAQVAAWVTSGVTPADPTGGGAVKERALDTARLVYDTTGQVEARTAVSRELAAEARRILYVGGLLALPLPVGADPYDTLPTYGLPTPLGGVGFDPFGYEAARDAGYWRVGY